MKYNRADQMLIAMLVVFVIIGLSLFCFAWGRIDEIDSNPLILELGKNASALLVLTVMGFVFQFAFKIWESEKRKREEQYRFIKAILDDLKSAYDSVEQSRNLIKLHRSSNVLCEQTVELFRSIVVLRNVKRALDPDFAEVKDLLEPKIIHMIKYLDKLNEEINSNYFEISNLQSEVDGNEVEGIIGQPTVWEKINELPNLREFLKACKVGEYRTIFIGNLDKASKVLRDKLSEEQPVQKRSKSFNVIWVIAALLFLNQAQAQPAEEPIEVIYGQAIVVDGDTVKIDNRSIRLAGIDTAEKEQPYGPLASKALKRIIDDRELICDVHGYGYYGRPLGWCVPVLASGNPSTVTINKTMVRTGHAAVGLRYGDEFVSQMHIAMKNCRGMWAVEYSGLPWCWRDEN